MDRKELESRRVSELKEMCKIRGIKCYAGKNLLRKDELISAILQHDNIVEFNDGLKDDNKELDNWEGGEEVETEKEPVIDLSKKEEYISNAQLGTIAAFRTPDGKVKSAKIIKRSKDRKRLMLETKYGRQYACDYKDIIWVRHGTAWPRGVYNLLKGVVQDG